MTLFSAISQMLLTRSGLGCYLWRDIFLETGWRVNVDGNLAISTFCARKKEEPHRIRCLNVFFLFGASGKVTVLMMTCESWDVTRRKWTLIWMTWRAEYMRLAMVWWIQSEQIHDPLVCNSHIKNSCIRSLPTFFDASAACSDTVHFFASNLVFQPFSQQVFEMYDKARC